MPLGTFLLLPLAVANPPGPVIPPPAHGPIPAVVRTPGLPDCAPVGPPAPVLMTKILAPAGVRVTLFPGTPTSRLYADPVTVGLRPGYVYRVELTGLPNRPNETLYPEIAVYGSLVPRVGMNVAEYPVGVNFSAADLEKAATGTFVTKVYYLENPLTAVPAQGTPDRPFEELVESSEVAVKAANDRGRPMMVVRLGNRVPDAAALAAASVPGTVLLPGEAYIQPASAPPVLPCSSIPLYDPILGPKIPGEECLTDGGDRNADLGIGADGRVRGLDASDVSVEYTTAGRKRVTTSNRVCLCVPRFAAVRTEASVGGLLLKVAANAEVQAVGPHSAANAQVAGALVTPTKPVGVMGAVRPMAQVGGTGLHILLGGARAQAIARVQGLQVTATAVGPEEITDANEFLVLKTIDPTAGVKIGDEVTVTIKYVNYTRKPITDVVVTDHLTPRLEYVPGSSGSDIPANTTTEPAEGGGTIVRFDIPGTLQPGQGGVVKFKAKVR